jgi:dihydrofolate reductase
MSPVSIIVAVDSAGGFGKNGKIPWNVPEDMKHFREKTKDSVCIMGRRTYEDMLEMWNDRQAARKKKTKSKKKSKKKAVEAVVTEPKEILPGRECFVVTSNSNLHCPGATAVPSISPAIQKCPADDKRPIFILGGYRLWVEAFSRQPVVHMTIIKGDDYECTKKFPIEILNKSYHIIDGTETDNCYFVTYAPKPIRRGRWSR